MDVLEHCGMKNLGGLMNQDPTLGKPKNIPGINVQWMHSPRILLLRLGLEEFPTDWSQTIS